MRATWLLIGALTLAGCASTPAAPEASGSASAGTAGLNVLATTTILGSVVGDIVRCAGGTATTLIPDGADPHDFAPSSEQVASVVRADVVVANGLGLEGGLSDALASAKADGATVFEVGPLVTPIDLPGTSTPDPHFWFDMTRMATAAQLIGDELATKGGEQYRTCATKVADVIRTAQRGVARTLASVPADRRVLVTDHDAFGYLAAAYGYRIAGAVIPSGTTLAEPSSSDLAALAKVIAASGVDAIFANASSPKVLADAVAGEVGSPVQVVDLYVDSLGAPGSGADTYLGLMQTDASRIATALGG